MIVLYILLAIIFLLALLFSFHIKFYLQLEDELEIHAGIGPIVLKLTPKKQKKITLSDFTYEKHRKRLEKERKAAAKKASKKAAKDEKKRQAKALADQAEKTTASADEAQDENKLSSIIDIISFILEEFPRFVSYFKTEIRMLDITVGGKDADAIARKYGKISALTALLIELLDSKTNMKQINPGAVQVRADFIAPKTKYRLHIRIKLRLFSILRVGVHTMKWIINKKIKEMKAK